MYERILVPTDGSRATERAVRNALDIAGKYDATVHALYVVDTSVYSSIEAGADVVIESLHEEGQTAVDEVADRARAAGVEAETEVVSGSAHQAILDYADEEAIDLIVMGTHGRTGIDRYLLGSVTEKVVRSSDVPVLTVRMDEEAGDAAGEPAD
ncbi:Nucleotide-binding universal stress protein, UspA family [Halopelagius inordinatus]|uniref:Nucleotide-binding universal stress protein, UspA family n=1 Tax=Halopelagius inordinatus TaxID=553467 RepID=A0A1I2PJ38_9EURY|nr:universal stress protein [Halopelagius inordinatus]SFG16172.1 Nucleotide-binding universal stress protein, UspA family [Halopelagius inordinatus]